MATQSSQAHPAARDARDTPTNTPVEQAGTGKPDTSAKTQLGQYAGDPKQNRHLRPKYVVQKIDGGHVTMVPVPDAHENSRFFRSQHTGQITFGPVHDDHLERFTPGKAYFMNFDPAD